MINVYFLCQLMRVYKDVIYIDTILLFFIIDFSIIICHSGMFIKILKFVLLIATKMSSIHPKISIQ